MRIPAGAEFVNPQPERTNHFSNVFVFHKPSRTFHVDDTLMVFNNPGFLLRRGAGLKDGGMYFHLSITNHGLLPHPDSPKQFYCWMEKMIHDWDFDSIVTAHNGVQVGGAKEKLKELMNRFEKKMAELTKQKAEAWKANGGVLQNPNSMEGAWSDDWRDTCECG
jgi:hypothetical protein